MRRIHRRAIWTHTAIGWTISLAALVILAGCGGSSSSGSGSGSGTSTGSCGDATTCQDSTLTVFSTVNQAFSSGLSGSVGSGNLNGYSFACTYGGTVTVNGTYSASSNPISYDISMVFSACDIGTAQPTNELVVNGTVDVSGSIDETTAYGTYNLTSSGVSVAGQSQGTAVSFNCPISIQLTYGSSPIYSVTSTVCGQGYSYTYP